MMKAIQYKNYGTSDVIEQVEVPTPSIQQENDVLPKPDGLSFEEAVLAQDFLAAGGVNGKVVLYVEQKIN